MNRFCVVCDAYSRGKMYWLQDDGYCCESCAIDNNVEVEEKDGEYDEKL